MVVNIKMYTIFLGYLYDKNMYLLERSLKKYNRLKIIEKLLVEGYIIIVVAC